jgi:hypothetical protein
MQSKYPVLNLVASLMRLAEWLKIRSTNKCDFTEDARRHRGLAKRLRAIAATLDEQEWFYLECKFDEDPPSHVGEDGRWITAPGANTARYKGLLWELRALAETAERMADENPKPRTKPELPMAADFFLHLWLAAGKDRPSLYDKSDAVTALNGVLTGAGYSLSIERVRGILSDALEKFDPHFCLDPWQLESFMVWQE